MLQTILAIVITSIIVAPITWFVANAYRRNVIEKKIGSAEDKAREIIDEALKTAETKKKEALLEVKEESIRTKNELDKETKERRAEDQKYERKRPWIRSLKLLSAVMRISDVRKRNLIVRDRK